MHSTLKGHITQDGKLKELSEIGKECTVHFFSDKASKEKQWESALKRIGFHSLTSRAKIYIDGGSIYLCGGDGYDYTSRFINTQSSDGYVSDAISIGGTKEYRTLLNFCLPPEGNLLYTDGTIFFRFFIDENADNVYCYISNDGKLSIKSLKRCGVTYISAGNIIPDNEISGSNNKTNYVSIIKDGTVIIDIHCEQSRTFEYHTISSWYDNGYIHITESDGGSKRRVIVYDTKTNMLYRFKGVGMGSYASVKGKVGLRFYHENDLYYEFRQEGIKIRKGDPTNRTEVVLDREDNKLGTKVDLTKEKITSV